MTAYSSATLSPQIADAVRAVLAGDDLPAVAARFGLAASDLQAMLTIYHAGGKAAVLASQSRGHWYAARIAFASGPQPEKTMARVVGPALDALRTGQEQLDWWFRRAPRHWHLY